MTRARAGPGPGPASLAPLPASASAPSPPCESRAEATPAPTSAPATPSRTRSREAATGRRAAATGSPPPENQVSSNIVLCNSRCSLPHLDLEEYDGGESSLSSFGTLRCAGSSGPRKTGGEGLFCAAFRSRLSLFLSASDIFGFSLSCSGFFSSSESPPKLVMYSTLPALAGVGLRLLRPSSSSSSSEPTPDPERRLFFFFLLD